MRTWTRTEGGCVSEPLARSPIRPPDPVIVLAGWEVSGRRAAGTLTLTDCTPLAKVRPGAPVGAEAGASLAVPLGGARRDGDGVLVVGSGPGEWLLIGPPGHADGIAARLEELAARYPAEPASVVDLTHGRALIR